MIKTGAGTLAASRPYQHLVRLLVVTMLAAVALTTVGGRPAEAAPTDCNAYAESALSGVAFCAGGDGYFRVELWCDFPWPFGGTTRNGPWRAAGSIPSRASCPLGTSDMDVFLGTITEI